MHTNHTAKIVFSALFAALCCVATMVIRIPSPLGYLNLGDGICLLCGLLLGPVYGFLAAGIGSALADLLSGYAVYAAPTLVIKGGLAVVAVLLFRLWGKKIQKRIWALLPACLIAELLTPAGYFVFELAVYGSGAAAAIPGNAAQAAVGVAVALALYPILRIAFKEDHYGS